jgi:hypothetical protein
MYLGAKYIGKDYIFMKHGRVSKGDIVKYMSEAEAIAHKKFEPLYDKKPVKKIVVEKPIEKKEPELKEDKPKKKSKGAKK